MSVTARLTDQLPPTSIFSSVSEASDFFQAGALGYSDSRQPGRFQGLSLHCRNWHVEPIEVEEVHSSLFDDRSVFPSGLIALDNALLRRGIDHIWCSENDLCCAAGASTEPKTLDLARMSSRFVRRFLAFSNSFSGKAVITGAVGPIHISRVFGCAFQLRNGFPEGADAPQAGYVKPDKEICACDVIRCGWQPGSSLWGRR